MCQVGRNCPLLSCTFSVHMCACVYGVCLWAWGQERQLAAQVGPTSSTPARTWVSMSTARVWGHLSTTPVHSSSSSLMCTPAEASLPLSLLHPGSGSYQSCAGVRSKLLAEPNTVLFLTPVIKDPINSWKTGPGT